jgi:hypothetical protein
MIQFELPATKLAWIEINSQILNACFSLQAIVSQPIRFMLLLWTWRLLNALKLNDLDAIRAYASQIHSEMPDISLVSETSPEVEMTPTNSSHDLTECTPMWKWKTIVVLMNCQCVFQYPISIVMWTWAANPQLRPGWVVPLFLPLSFLSGAISGVWPLLLTRKKNKARKGTKIVATI